ncbi:MAG: diadenylate cyclase [Paraglaciecola sp.]
MPLLFDIGFLSIRIWDVLDVAIFGYLIYRVYKLLRGSIAFNIFIGVVMLYVAWWLVSALKMDLLSILLSQFASVGVIVLMVIFQPEVRRFLLLLGNTTLRQRSNFLSRLWVKNFESSNARKREIIYIVNAVLKMGKERTGALIVLSKNFEMEDIRSSGTTIDANISQLLLLSIFQKESPLHDGAVVIGNGKILAAGCILPVSDSTKLPSSAGLRHRAAVGITERTNVAALIVSEESGTLSFALEGKLQRRLTEENLRKILKEHY